MTNHRLIEVRGFKYPHRPTGIAVARLLGEDVFGQWLGIARDTPWWAANHSRYGMFERSFVKLVPSGTFWTACFNSVDPVVDVDIVLPVQWDHDVLEEIDLELDILRSTDGRTVVRDQEAFTLARELWAMPDGIAEQAEKTCEQIRELVERGAEPFDAVGQAWLSRYLAEIGTAGT